MRVIAGRLSGRQFDSPKSFKTHPMSDKARGALFNVLGDIDGLEVLDAFAGSGALSFEAVSRGAASATAIDNSHAAQKAIARNICALGIESQVKIVKASADIWLNMNPQAIFDVVLCDPPYGDLQPALIQRLAARLKPDGVFVLSWPGGKAAPRLDGLRLLNDRSYGDMTLAFYASTTRS